MRKKAELLEEQQRLFDDLWYARHILDPIIDANTPADIVEAANRAAERIVQSRDADYLDAITSDPYELGLLSGRLMAIRWALGWDTGLLDT